MAQVRLLFLEQHGYGAADFLRPEVGQALQTELGSAARVDEEHGNFTALFAGADGGKALRLAGAEHPKAASLQDLLPGQATGRVGLAYQHGCAVARGFGKGEDGGGGMRSCPEAPRECKGGTVALLALHLNGAAHSGGQFMADGQAETGAAILSGDGGVRLMKGGKELADLLP